MSEPAKSPRVNPDLIHLREIILLESSLETSEDFLKSARKPPGSEVKIGHQAGGNPDENIFDIRLEIQIVGQDEQGQALGLKARFLILFRFEVDNLADFIQHQDEERTAIDSKLTLTLLNISYSTTRGMVLSRTQGTFFDGIILPVISPTVFLPPTSLTVQ